MTTLLLLHIASFSLSLILLPALLIAVVAGKNLSNAVRYSSLVTTIIGVASGTALLLASPSGAYCALLSVYVMVFAALYIKSSKAQLARTKAFATIDR
jgi:hypothetical protein